MILKEIENYLNQYPWSIDLLKLIGVILLSSLAYLITNKIVLKGIQKVISKTKTEFDDILLNRKVLSRLSIIIPLIILHEFTYLIPVAEKLTGRILESLILVFILLSIGLILTSFSDIYQKIDRYKKRPIKGYLQVIKIIIYIWGAVLIVGIFSGQSPWALLGGIGALTAIIILIFKDTILSFVASIQISSYDLVQVGDWIEMPKYGVDGDVMDISLNVIKVQNFDKTITTIPTYKLIEESFKNWRGMQLSGGRRIKRAIFIDQSSIKFVDDEIIAKYQKINVLSDYVKRKTEEIAKYNNDRKIGKGEIVNGRRMTNIGTFRSYIKEYLRNRDDINKGLTFLIRQLPPGPEGLPIEIYVFANTTAWIEYEDIQADIFDHILAVVPQFDLRIFQNPTGHDFKSLNKVDTN